MSTQKDKSKIVAIIMMIFLFGMISFVTNLAAPMGIVLKSQFGLGNSAGMLGNMMNFGAYLFFGIASGNLLTKKGYKFSALTAIAVGFIGVFIQFLSGHAGGLEGTIFGLPVSFFIYLAGAFVSGISVCLLNTVVNPMLNTLGGGGSKGNQLIQTGGTFNSVAATITPIVIGSLIGEVSKANIKEIFPFMYVALAIFACTFVVLSLVAIPEPHLAANKAAANAPKALHSPWAFRHFVLGAVAIFVYVGIEIGLPGTLNFFLSDITGKGAGLDPAAATKIGGSVAATYWFLMMIGRLVGASIGGKVGSKPMLVTVSGVGILFVLIAMFAPLSSTVSMPTFDTEAAGFFSLAQVPISALFIVLCGLCTSVMWGGIFNLAVEGLGKYVTAASGIFMMMVVGGGVLPLIQNSIADHVTYLASYWVPLLGMAYMLYYALVGSKNVNKDIPVE